LYNLLYIYNKCLLTITDGPYHRGMNWQCISGDRPQSFFQCLSVYLFFVFTAYVNVPESFTTQSKTLLIMLSTRLFYTFKFKFFIFFHKYKIKINYTSSFSSLQGDKSVYRIQAKTMNLYLQFFSLISI
jgi:hypothetical protein